MWNNLKFQAFCKKLCCEHWAIDQDFYIDLKKIKSSDIAAYRRSALYFRSLKRKGKSNAQK